MFSWNETIQKMNKNNSLKGLLKKLSVRNVQVIILTNNDNIDLSCFQNEYQLERFVDNNNISGLYIRTNISEYEVPLDKYDTYIMSNDKLTIKAFDTSYKIEF